MNRYTRVVPTPGKSYMCGCDLQRDNVGVRWIRETCRQHGVPVQPLEFDWSVEQAPAKGHTYDRSHPVHCSCNAVPEAAYGILENRDERR